MHEIRVRAPGVKQANISEGGSLELVVVDGDETALALDQPANSGW